MNRRPASTDIKQPASIGWSALTSNEEAPSSSFHTTKVSSPRLPPRFGRWMAVKSQQSKKSTRQCCLRCSKQRSAKNLHSVRKESGNVPSDPANRSVDAEQVVREGGRVCRTA